MRPYRRQDGKLCDPGVIGLVYWYGRHRVAYYVGQMVKLSGSDEVRRVSS